MAMQLRALIRTTLERQCHVCRRFVRSIPSPPKRLLKLNELPKAEQYSICCCCLMYVPVEMLSDRRYLERWYQWRCSDVKIFGTPRQTPSHPDDVFATRIYRITATLDTGERIQRHFVADSAAAAQHSASRDGLIVLCVERL